MIRPKVGDIYYWYDKHSTNTGKVFEIAISREEYEEFNKNNKTIVKHKDHYVYGKVLYDEDEILIRGDIGYSILNDSTTVFKILDNAQAKTMKILYEKD